MVNYRFLKIRMGYISCKHISTPKISALDIAADEFCIT